MPVSSIRINNYITDESLKPVYQERLDDFEHV
jgi:hypothetical protein